MFLGIFYVTLGILEGLKTDYSLIAQPKLCSIEKDDVD